GHLGAPKSPALAMVALATVGFAAASVVANALRTPFFARYLLPLMPLLAILVLSSNTARAPSTRWTRFPAVTAFVVLAAFGAAYVATSASFDGATWDVAHDAATRTTDQRRVD